MNVSDQILNFYKSLNPPKQLPRSVEVMNPYQDDFAFPYTQQFYQKYYNDTHKRVILFGINPGRFGGGITGIPFTDPITLENNCEIINPFEKRAELSSKYIYEMIDTFGSVEKFYRHFYISAISPLGYIENNKNLNYYDITDWKNIFLNYAIELIERQTSWIRNDVAFAIGKGENYKFLKALNDEKKFFKRIEVIPHPRWVMQYRLKRKAEFVKDCVDKLYATGL